MPVWPQAFICLLVVCGLNIAVQIDYRPSVKGFVPAIHEPPAFLAAAVLLATIVDLALSSVVGALSTETRFGSLRRTVPWLMFEPEQAMELVSTVHEYINLIFLFDVNGLVFATEQIRNHKTELQARFLALGELDVVQSVAAWRRTLSHWSTPTLIPPEKRLIAVELFHPLIEQPVANSISLDGESALVTGSNMAGKTTFIRTIGVNAVLAQTLTTVRGKEWRAPVSDVRTSIGRSDILMDGKSYYLAEAETILSLIRSKSERSQHLFLLDEIFRGANTVERVAAAYEVLKRLELGSDLVMVATHDVELLDSLAGAYAGYHVAEQVTDSALSFDYRIKAGPASTRKTIALLRRMDYPAVVVEDALAKVGRAELPAE